jgi:NADH-ubiquinone oxidoreductase chain 6
MQNLNYFSLLDLGYQPFILDIISLLAVLSAIVSVTSNNPIVSVLFLIALFVNISGYLILVGIHFIGLSYLLVYIGAVSILFLFVLMLINIRISELQSHTSNSLPLGYFVGIIFLLVLNRAMPFKNTEGIVSMFNLGSSTETYDDLYFVSLNSLEASLAPMTDISSTGSVMYSSHAIWFVVVSLILLIAMVGSIAVTTNTADSGSSK